MRRVYLTIQKLLFIFRTVFNSLMRLDAQVEKAEV
jgi:hypothetical protein